MVFMVRMGENESSGRGTGNFVSTHIKVLLRSNYEGLISTEIHYLCSNLQFKAIVARFNNFHEISLSLKWKIDPLTDEESTREASKIVFR